MLLSFEITKQESKALWGTIISCFQKLDDVQNSYNNKPIDGVDYYNEEDEYEAPLRHDGDTTTYIPYRGMYYSGGSHILDHKNKRFSFCTESGKGVISFSANDNSIMIDGFRNSISKFECWYTMHEFIHNDLISLLKEKVPLVSSSITDPITFLGKEFSPTIVSKQLAAVNG